MTIVPVPPVTQTGLKASLLTVSKLIPFPVAWGDGNATLGASSVSVSCNLSERHACDEGAQYDPTPLGSYVFEPFMLSQALECKGGPLPGLHGYAKQNLQAHLAYLFSAELDSSIVGNPDLQNTATLVPGGPVSLSAGITALLKNVPMGSEKVLHVPHWFIPSMQQLGLLSSGAPVMTTAGGTVLVSPGPGYSGNGPGGVSPTAGNTFIYITGPVEYSVEADDPDPELDQANQQNRMNYTYQRVNRAGVLRFDPCDVKAIEVTPCP